MNSDRTDWLEHRAEVHAALGDVSRLRIVDLLAVSDASSSELGRSLAMPSNLLAHHLKVLETAGLVVRRRSEGDARRSYLSLSPSCRAGRADDVVALDGVVASPRRVLFVCTANTARSHLAAALWRRVSRVRAASAGTHPGDRINPAAAATAKRHGMALPTVSPRLLADVMQHDDLVITVCDRAHEELGELGWAHWSVPDPVPDGTDAAFDAALDDLTRRVDALAPRVRKTAS
jgi:protein-tyrosine-phosphatase/DNA-binding HxlR family transcriptional regulator